MGALLELQSYGTNERLRRQKQELIVAIKHLLAKPRCKICRAAVQEVLKRIEREG